MDVTTTDIVKLFVWANIAAAALLLWLLVKPLLGFGTFGFVASDGWRYGYGLGGWTVQHSKTYEVHASGRFPWYDWWFDRWFEKHYGRKPEPRKPS